jgi:hypothetical protein
MFVCYGTTIEEQSELLNRRWAKSPMHPNTSGHDPIIAQADANGGRGRFFDFPTSDGPRCNRLTQDWMILNGGSYFFSPPTESIAEVLGA